MFSGEKWDKASPTVFLLEDSSLLFLLSLESYEVLLTGLSLESEPQNFNGIFLHLMQRDSHLSTARTPVLPTLPPSCLHTAPPTGLAESGSSLSLL